LQPEEMALQHDFVVEMESTLLVAAAEQRDHIKLLSHIDGLKPKDRSLKAKNRSAAR
jgi:hypothetical protein